ncbi:unnamed protein product [Rotaria sp. Silwood2]|nr:unnamed protein product [Rotaria sp. Silwood2]CAF4422163.1 unnamed protein product [Rotaria sp. Silwood2]
MLPTVPSTRLRDPTKPPPNLSGSSLNNWFKNTYKQLQNYDYQLKYPPFYVPDVCYQVFHIQRFITLEKIQLIVQHIKNCRLFSIDTESDCFTRELALIQIHTIPIELPSMIILIELHHLPSTDTLLFKAIYALVQLIFKSGNTLYSWGPLVPWIERTLPHSEECKSGHYESQRYSCTCIPHFGTNEFWSLQNAIRYTCNQFLDKSQTKNPWEQLLDPLYSTLPSSTLNNMIYYAIYDCLVVSYLHRPVLESWNLDQLKQSTIDLLLTTPPSIFDQLEDISDDDIDDNEPQTNDELIINDSDSDVLFNRITELPSSSTQIFSTKVKSHACRSCQSRTKRNKKRNLTRRAFRYKYVIRRSIYYKYSMYLIKTILHKLNIHFTHIIKHDKTTLIIGIKSKELREQYDKNIPLNIFDRHHYYRN